MIQTLWSQAQEVMDSLRLRLLNPEIRFEVRETPQRKHPVCVCVCVCVCVYTHSNPIPFGNVNVFNVVAIVYFGFRFQSRLLKGPSVPPWESVGQVLLARGKKIKRKTALSHLATGWYNYRRFRGRIQRSGNFCCSGYRCLNGAPCLSTSGWMWELLCYTMLTKCQGRDTCREIAKFLGDSAFF